MEVATKERQWQVPAAPVADESAGGISTQTLDSNDFSLFMSIAHSSNSGRIQVFSNWTHEVTYSLWDNEAGEKPNDITGFGFAEADYLLDDWQSSEYVDRTDYSASGIAFEYCDSCCGLYEDATGSCTPQGEEFEIEGWCQVQLSPKTGGTKDHVYFDYHHLFSEVVVDGIGISSSGISVTLSEEQNSWNKDARIHQDRVEEGDSSRRSRTEFRTGHRFSPARRRPVGHRRTCQCHRTDDRSYIRTNG